jgi:hypothetical protein
MPSLIRFGLDPATLPLTRTTPVDVFVALSDDGDRVTLNIDGSVVGVISLDSILEEARRAGRRPSRDGGAIKPEADPLVEALVRLDLIDDELELDAVEAAITARRYRIEADAAAAKVKARRRLRFEE